MTKLLKQKMDTFESVAREWYQMFVISTSASHAKRIMAYLETYLFPFFGVRPIALVRESELLDVFRRIEINSPDTAHRVMSICDRTFRHAFSVGIIQSNPVDRVRGALAPIQKKVVTAPDLEDT